MYFGHEVYFRTFDTQIQPKYNYDYLMEDSFKETLAYVSIDLSFVVA